MFSSAFNILYGTVINIFEMQVHEATIDVKAYGKNQCCGTAAF
jgi:hypothetical protein